MKTIQNKIADLLEVDGWEVETVITDDLAYWACEIWELTSLWSPKGSTAFLTFLIDPQLDRSKSEKEQKVWSVGSSKGYPATRSHAESNGIITVHSIKNKTFESLSEMLENIRSIQ
jgi:hypothetical protein